MRLVIADTAPINYLVLIGSIEILPELFEKVILPSAVRDELADEGAPPAVRQWIAAPPSWIDVRSVTASGRIEFLEGLDDGERAAIALMAEIGADLLLIDDRQGAAVARRHGFIVTGTLGVLALAGRRGLLDLARAFSLL